MDIEQRSLELKAMHWKQIQKAAIAVGLDKPEDQTWEEFALEVARFEASLSASEPESPESLNEPPVMPFQPEIEPDQPVYDADLIQHQAIESAHSLTVSSSNAVSDAAKIYSDIAAQNTSNAELLLDGNHKPAYATDFYERSGIPYCLQCGEKYLAVDGMPVCPEKRVGCDRDQSVEAV